MIGNSSFKLVENFSALSEGDRSFIRKQVATSSPTSVDLVLERHGFKFLGILSEGNISAALLYKPVNDGRNIDVEYLWGRANKQFVREHTVSPAQYLLGELTHRGAKSFFSRGASRHRINSINKLVALGHFTRSLVDSPVIIEPTKKWQDLVTSRKKLL